MATPAPPPDAVASLPIATLLPPVAVAFRPTAIPDVPFAPVPIAIASAFAPVIALSPNAIALRPVPVGGFTITAPLLNLMKSQK